MPRAPARDHSVQLALRYSIVTIEATLQSESPRPAAARSPFGGKPVACRLWLGGVASAVGCRLDMAVTVAAWAYGVLRPTGNPRWSEFGRRQEAYSFKAAVSLLDDCSRRQSRRHANRRDPGRFEPSLPALKSNRPHLRQATARSRMGAYLMHTVVNRPLWPALKGITAGRLLRLDETDKSAGHLVH